MFRPPGAGPLFQAARAFIDRYRHACGVEPIGQAQAAGLGRWRYVAQQRNPTSSRARPYFGLAEFRPCRYRDRSLRPVHRRLLPSHRRAPWKTLKAVASATFEWVSRFDHYPCLDRSPILRRPKLRQTLTSN